MCVPYKRLGIYSAVARTLVPQNLARAVSVGERRRQNAPEATLNRVRLHRDDGAFV